MAREYPYKEVHALLLCWDDADDFEVQESKDLSTVLNNDYELSSVTNMRICKKGSAYSVFLQAFADWLTRNSGPDNLLIFYYTGHGNAYDAGHNTNNDKCLLLGSG